MPSSYAYRTPVIVRSAGAGTPRSGSAAGTGTPSTPTRRARAAPAAWMSAPLNSSPPTGLNRRWKSTAAAAVSPTVTAPARTRR